MCHSVHRAIWLSFIVLLSSGPGFAQPARTIPEKLGVVIFPTSCATGVQGTFERGVALLHSFAYEEASQSFQQVLAADPACAMAHWGIAMSYYHQLWEPPTNAELDQKGKKEMAAAVETGAASVRERAFITALDDFYANLQQPVRERMSGFERAMCNAAAVQRNDVEGQVFCALAVLSTASPTDRTHANQKRAVAMLEPLRAAYPRHPGIVHYLIHAYDNSEMAARGIQVAREYSRIAPTAPHALHMPSHIFTRRGLWNDSVQSNLAARRAAHEHGDIGEELHAMDYLVYAYLQMGQTDRASTVVAEMRKFTGLPTRQFKVGYAATAMPVRIAVERKDWRAASSVTPLEGAPPQVTAIAVWARAIGLARSGHPAEATAEVKVLSGLESKLGPVNAYWADQVRIQLAEANGWVQQSLRDTRSARESLTRAAEIEDSLEKLPLTPGPIVPAREQLGELLLTQGEPGLALAQFELSLKESPARRNALNGALQAARKMNAKEKVAQYETALAQTGQGQK